jgi:hypothetical protein
MKSPSFASVPVLALVLGAQAAATTISFSNTIFDTNYVASAVGLRDVGTGDLTLSGLSGAITRAYLYWHGPTDSSDPAANAAVTFNGTDITGTNIGFSDDNFWDYENSQAYRADVTALVTGNGTYSLSNFQKMPAVAINGAALLVFYDDGDSSNDRDVVLFHGNDSNFDNAFDPAGWSLALPGINYTAGNANLTLLVSDGQDYGPNDDGTLQVNGTALVSGGLFQGLAPKAPGAGVNNGSVFDVEQYDITPFLSAGSNTITVTLDEELSVVDALSAIVAAIDLPAGAAPEIPGASANLLVGAGIAVVALCGRRRDSRQADDSR